MYNEMQIPHLFPLILFSPFNVRGRNAKRQAIHNPETDARNRAISFAVYSISRLRGHVELEVVVE